MNSVTVRKAEIADLGRIQELNQKLFIFEKKFGDSYNENWMYEKRGKEYFQKRISNEDGKSICIVVETNKMIVGYLAGCVGLYSYRSVNPIAEIENMFVLDGFRKQGFGARLVEEFLKISREMGAKRIKVSMHSKNEHAQDFYKKFGLSDHELVMEMDI